jgi:hypothetical protein
MSRKVVFKKQNPSFEIIAKSTFFHFLKNNQDKLAFDFIMFSPPTKPLHPLHNQILLCQLNIA